MSEKSWALVSRTDVERVCRAAESVLSAWSSGDKYGLGSTLSQLRYVVQEVRSESEGRELVRRGSVLRSSGELRGDAP